MGRRAAPADCAATSVKQGKRYPVILTHRQQLFLSSVLCPAGCQHACILGTVRVANHHRKPAVGTVSKAGVLKQCADDAGGTIEVVEGLK